MTEYSNKILAAVSQAKQTAAYFYSHLIDFIYPPQCLICDDLHYQKHFFICHRCECRFDLITAPFCMKCKERMYFGESKCLLCRTRNPISKVLALSIYDDLFRPLIQAFKYSGVIPIGNYLAQLLARHIMQILQDDKFDVVVPVPLYPRRERKRGFNQAGLIAEAISAKLLVNYEDRALIRIKNTRTQTGLSRQERRENIKGAFECADKTVFAGKKVLLVDDVTTTGATATEAAKILKASGAKEIVLAVICAAGNDTPDNF